MAPENGIRKRVIRVTYGEHAYRARCDAYASPPHRSVEQGRELHGVHDDLRAVRVACGVSGSNLQVELRAR